jgi:endonuclease YncB( thermonuclease family)
LSQKEPQIKIERVVDGDTIYVDVDLGFFLRQVMNLRLKGIDTPEIRGEERPEGLKAKQFVEDTLSQCPAVVIRTYKVGKYGRYIADLWYKLGSNDEEEILANGKLLNQELLDRGLAEPTEK